tara:strand:- start:4454 stop:4588 length:135 start_codon:yes stop_codon:yes gene_type:complete
MGFSPNEKIQPLAEPVEATGGEVSLRNSTTYLSDLGNFKLLTLC